MKKGFTLIELLVVIAIIGVLATVVVVSMRGATDKAKDSNIISAMAQLPTQAILIYDTEGEYSKSGKEFSCAYTAGGGVNISTLCSSIDKNLGGTGDYAAGTLFGVGNFFVTSSEYCVYTALNVEYGGAPDFFCLDSSGHIGRTTTTPCGTFEEDVIGDWSTTCPPIR